MKKLIVCIVTISSIVANADDISFQGVFNDIANAIIANDGGAPMTPSQMAPRIAAMPSYTTVTNIVNDMTDYAVTTSVTNQVAAAMNDLLGPNWRTTYGGGLLGAIAAIFAAIAVLKRGKVGMITCTGVANITPSDGTANLSSLFSGSNTPLVNTIKEYGGTKIKQDDQGNYYYDVED